LYFFFFFVNREGDPESKYVRHAGARAHQMRCGSSVDAKGSSVEVRNTSDMFGF